MYCKAVEITKIFKIPIFQNHPSLDSKFGLDFAQQFTPLSNLCLLCEVYDNVDPLLQPGLPDHQASLQVDILHLPLLENLHNNVFNTVTQ